MSLMNSCNRLYILNPKKLKHGPVTTNLHSIAWSSDYYISNINCGLLECNFYDLASYVYIKFFMWLSSLVTLSKGLSKGKADDILINTVPTSA